ncbi:hypothetical protein [Actinomadura algeriensis]|uniref:Uncharacterized protein n=1 Tax=Actinomadura algeriensis TaxID=1679523 RepID=A0ABR9JRM2_9ACTN|nr:hypothetical protein [Actinomadura algeriensis]MBE1533231.1 hypothetical protein [Actinomadura algeriensis]
MDDPRLFGDDEPLVALADRLSARGWNCQLQKRAGDSEPALLRLQPPGAYGVSTRTVEVEVRAFEREPHFAYAQNSRRPIAPVAQLDRAVRAVVHVHGGTMPAPPQVPDGLLAAFESLRSERQDGLPAARGAGDEVEE